MKVRSRRYKQDKEKIPAHPLPLNEAVELLKKLSNAKFDETVEISINLGIDPRKSDHMIRGSYSLPHGTGKKKKVIAFAEGEDAQAAKEAGAIEVGGADLVEKIQGGWLDFDVAISTPAMMRHVRKLGKILGPQGKMPSPKAGTVTQNIKTAVEEFIAGKIEFRVDPGAVLHIPVGKKSFPENHLQENIESFLAFLATLRPATAKGTFIQKVTVSTTMSPAIEIALKRN
ncbi:MAG: 50S ribosomal protein L1 [Planctomycetota bacterium]|nr:MAG: 50S ribosomal protein L1 [Planctomycetota bacterium]